ncbi:MAG: SDR family NAD(P)-dependent oxidoreductase [Verrucomicrobiales bacterium]|nr:SDR family NAD(P)-dependent oxidoreductase [Verrucomicrobiales bacterium]
MKVLVTGGAGFIGSHTVDRLLRDGAEVAVLDEFNDYYNPAIKRANVAAFQGRVRVFEGDLRDRETVHSVCREGGFDAIIHLAARAGVRPSISDPELYLNTNIYGTHHLLEAARACSVPRFLFASSSSVYGINKKVPFSETDRIEQTISPYAMTKMCGEQMCSNYANLYGIRTVCLRFFTVYGPRQRPDLAISKFTRLIDEGKPVPRYGDGTTARDYTYVDDIVDGIMAALAYEGELFDIFNLGGSQTTTLNELIAAVEQALGKQAVIDPQPMQPGDVPRTFADVSKAGRLLGYAPHTPIREGIPRFVRWYQEMKARQVTVA